LIVSPIRDDAPSGGRENALSGGRHDIPERGEDECATLLSRVATLLARIDALPADACGTLAFGGNPPSSMLRIEARRVCWATSDSASRLMDRLRHTIRAEAGELDALFRECRERGTPLGQTLVARNWISAAEFRAALLEHTAAAVARIAGTTRSEAAWLPSREERHDAHFTFSPAELLTRVADAEWGPLAQLARDELARVLESGGRGCAYVPSGDGLLPLGVVGDELVVEEILALGRWAQRALLDATRFTQDPRFVSLARSNGDSLTAWSRSGFVYAALCTERSDLGCILARLHATDEVSHEGSR
jgi:hypothetical protein